MYHYLSDHILTLKDESVTMMYYDQLLYSDDNWNLFCIWYLRLLIASIGQKFQIP